MLDMQNRIFGWNKKPSGRLEALTLTNSRAQNSVHSPANQVQSAPGLRLIPSFLKAFMLYHGFSIFDGEDNTRAALGKTTTGEWMAEVQSATNPALTTIILYDPNSGKVKGGTLDTIKKKMFRYAIGDNSGQQADPEKAHTSDGTAVWLALMPKLLEESEASELSSLIANTITSANAEKSGDLESCDDYFATLSHNVYLRLTGRGQLTAGDVEIENVGGKSSVGMIPSLSYSSLKGRNHIVSETIIGHFESVQIGKGTTAVSLDKKETDLGLTLDPATKPFMIEELDGYVATKTASDVLKVQKLGLANESLKINNFFFIGPPGSGKSEDTRGIAYYAGLPHYVQCLSSGITEETLKGIIVPTTSEDVLTKEEKRVVESVTSAFPSEIEIDLDTKHAYQKLTGKTEENISALDVYEVAYAKLLHYAKHEKPSEDNGITYRFIPSPLVLAAKYGGIVEVQEPSSVRDETVMTCLNEFMNKPDGVLETPVGPIRRHPNCIVIMTDNYSTDIGNSNMNQAVKDRAGTMTFWYERADKAHMIDMIKAAKINIKEKLLPVMADAIEAMDVEAQKMDNSIKAVAGYRSFKAWAQAIAMGFSFAESFELCVLNKMATNPDEKEFLKDFAENNTRVYIEEE